MDRVVGFENSYKDIDAALQFYKDVFGWKFDEPRWNYWPVRTGHEGQPGVDGGFGLPPEENLAPQTKPYTTRLMIDVDDMDATIAKAVGAGGTVIKDKMDFGDFYLAYLEDPEGIGFGLSQNKNTVLESLYHVQIPVTNLDRAITWYAENLGFTLRDRQEATAWMVLPGGPLLMLWTTSDGERANFRLGSGEQMPVLLWRTRRIHDLQRRLEALGVTITTYEDHGFALVLKFLDPDGNMWGVLQDKPSRDQP